MSEGSRDARAPAAPGETVTREPAEALAAHTNGAARPERADRALSPEGRAQPPEGSAPSLSKTPPSATTAAAPVAAPQRATPPATAGTTATLPAVRPDQVAHAEPAPKPKAGTPRRTRKARLRLSRLDPWSVMKTGFLFSIAGGIVLVVAVYVVWTVVGSSGLFTSVDSTVQSIVGTPGDTTPFRLEDYISSQKVVGFAAVLASVDVVIFTALATLASFLYNLAATMLGGLEVTLAED